MQPSEIDRTSGEVDWPTALGKRTDPAAYRSTSRFGVTLARALDEIERQLDLLGADDYRLSTAAPHRKSDGRPYADAKPDDPAVVVRWFVGEDRYAVGCDRYDHWRDNARSVGLYLEEKRKMADRPIATVENEFTVAQLPSGDDDQRHITLDRPAHEVIGVQQDAPKSVIKAAVRERKKEAHPDQGGSQRELKRVLRAEQELLGDQDE